MTAGAGLDPRSLEPHVMGGALANGNAWPLAGEGARHAPTSFSMNLEGEPALAIAWFSLLTPGCTDTATMGMGARSRC